MMGEDLLCAVKTREARLSSHPSSRDRLPGNSERNSRVQSSFLLDTKMR